MLKTNNLNVNNGIFQCDSLSPLLFCITLILLSIEPKATDYGFKNMTKKINLLFYMDDLKLYAKNDDDLESLLSTVKRFNDDIGIHFDLDYYANITFKKALLVKSKNITLEINTEITE